MKALLLGTIAGIACLSGCQPATPNAREGGPKSSSASTLPSPSTMGFTAPSPQQSNSATANFFGEQNAPTDPILARLDGQPITLSQIQGPLLQGYGLNVLLNYVTLQLAKHEAQRANVFVSESDLIAERQQTLAKMFPDADKSEYGQLLDQLLTREHRSAAEFDMVLQTNAYLRKAAEPLCRNKLTDDNLQQAFRETYGETVQVRHIECANMQEIAEAQRRLAAHVGFAQVAAELSRNAQTKLMGGALPPFSRQAANIPQAFKEVAFALSEGQVSDAVEANGAYHLILLEKRIAPRVVKFEDVKETIRNDLQDRLVQAVMQDFRSSIAQEAQRQLIIENSGLKAQYDAKLNQHGQQINNREEIRKQLERERQQAIEHAATQPASQPSAPSSAPATQGQPMQP